MKEILPFLLLLLCPLMHVGMMLFMGRSCHGEHAENKKKADPTPQSGAAGDPQ
ncbi:MAG: DUF2933 domain-containing protein [Bacillota bacterium]|nr:DUF2933 domain-containing protein [Bacillota bacterium]